MTQDMLTAAFIPFGDVSQVDIPLDPGTRASAPPCFVLRMLRSVYCVWRAACCALRNTLVAAAVPIVGGVRGRACSADARCDALHKWRVALIMLPRWSWLCCLHPLPWRATVPVYLPASTTMCPRATPCPTRKSARVRVRGVRGC